MKFQINPVYKNLLFVGVSSLIFGLYIHGALRHSHKVNVNKEWVDQSAYMENMKQSGYQYEGNRNRMPVYPFIQSLFYRPSMTDDEFFSVGKSANIGLSVFILVGLFLIFKHYLPLSFAINLQLIVMFTLFIFKAAYFQPFNLNFSSIF